LHGARYCEREDGIAAKGERRVEFASARVLQAVRRAVGRSICSASGGIASKYDLEQSAFRELNS
jgi:hypothetical protein